LCLGISGPQLQLPATLQVATHTGTDMALNRRNPEVEQLVRLEQDRTGRCLADALDEIALACAARPVLDDRQPDDILGYDDAGLPT